MDIWSYQSRFHPSTNHGPYFQYQIKFWLWSGISGSGSGFSDQNYPETAATQACSETEGCGLPDPANPPNHKEIPYWTYTKPMEQSPPNQNQFTVILTVAGNYWGKWLDEIAHLSDTTIQNHQECLCGNTMKTGSTCEAQIAT